MIKAKDGWFHLDPQYKAGNEKVSMATLIDAYHNKSQEYYRSSNSWLKIPEFIKDNNWSLTDNKKELSLSKLAYLRLQAFSGKFDNLVGTKKIFELEEKSSKHKIKEKDCTLSLRPYQKEGLNWLTWLYNNDLHGLLADDMGLGKTHQAMALMDCINKAQKKKCQFLVIAPTTVIDHWQNKIEGFCPDLNPKNIMATKGKHPGLKRRKPLRA